MDSKEKRVRSLTGIFYSKPEVKKCIVEFSQNREVVPRFFEGFGKRPDTINYPGDVDNLVKKGATSFHVSEEIWDDPLRLDSGMNRKEQDELRKSWDLLIDIDSPFLDYSKIVLHLIIEALEQHGVKNYGIKFSGSKGFHLIVSGKAFPREYNGQVMKDSFPEWPRAICNYLLEYIRDEYNQRAGELSGDFEAIEKRTNVTKDELTAVYCMSCNNPAEKGMIVSYKCSVCGMEIERKNPRAARKRLKCIRSGCEGVLELVESNEYHYCDRCKDPENDNLTLSSNKYPEKFQKPRGVHAGKIAKPDLILVAPRHLFRMPYSLHEKTSLASVVLERSEIDSFNPKDASPLSIEKVREFMPENEEGEARRLLSEALDWQKGQEIEEQKDQERRYSKANFEEVDSKNITEDMFPEPIKELLKGLEDGKKRGLFILITFLNSLNFPPEYIEKKVREWNEKNEPPIREGYIRSQISWHMKQKKKILPPNYDNESFYKDLGLLKKKPKSKNPLVDVKQEIWKRNKV